MKNNKGFSLVELIVVIAIMAILAAVAVTSFSIYIKRAQESSDMDYISNVLYRVQLFSLENGVEVQQVVISPTVDGPEDIQLIIGKDENGNPIYYEDVYGDGKQNEIYETVGDYTMYGEYLPDDVIIKPIIPGGSIGGGGGITGGGNDNHTHQWSANPTSTKESTCVEYGYKQYECTVDGCDAVNTVNETTLGKHKESKVGGTSEYEIHQCSECGNLVIKSTTGNAIVQLPKEEQ